MIFSDFLDDFLKMGSFSRLLQHTRGVQISANILGYLTGHRSGVSTVPT
jgi:hypothetical protein